MQVRDTTTRYGSVTQILHWVMFLFIIALFVIANSMTSMANSPEKFQLYGLHKSLGMTLFFVLLGRIYWRLTNATPTDPETPDWEHKAAHGLHIALYLVLLLMPISGMLMTLAGDHPLSWFGLIDLPNWLGKSPFIETTAKTIHGLCAYALMLLTLGHVGAALWHKFIRKDNIMERMLPFVARK